MVRKHYHYLFVLVFNLAIFFMLYHWFVRHINLSSFIHDIHQTQSHSITLVFFLYLIVIFFAAIRFVRLQNCTFMQSLRLVSITFGLNNILPFRAGDVLRLYFAHKFYGFSVSKTLITTFTERYLDLIMLLVCGAALILWGSAVNDDYVIYLFATLFSLSLVALVLYRILIVKPGRLAASFRRIEFLDKALAALECTMAQPRKIKLILQSVAVWGMLLFVYYYFFLVNLPHSHFRLYDAALLMFTTTLCFAIPYSVAGLGVFEAAITYCLVTFVGVNSSQALALAMVFHFATALPQVLMMFVALLAARPHDLAHAVD